MTFDNALDFLEDGKLFVLTAHENPDADGLGAEYALCRSLAETGRTALVLNSDPVIGKFAFIDQGGILKTVENSTESIPAKGGYRLIILDTNDIYNLGYAGDSLLTGAERSLIIDHHESHEGIEKDAFIDNTASSTCELIYEILSAKGWPIPLDAAEALYTGIIYDTGSFAYSKTTVRTFAAGLALLKKGVKPNVIHNKMYESSSIGSLLLKKRVLSTLELHENEKIAVQTMPKSAIVETGAQYEDAEDFINIPLQGISVEVSVFFKENKDGLRCSMRSKGSVNVAQIAQSFGGGGHKTASGFKCHTALENIKPKVLEKIGKALKQG